MTNHEKIYRGYFDIAKGEYAPCERCILLILTGLRGIEFGVGPQQDIHHTEFRGMGGDPTSSKDRIELLAGLCRSCHNVVEMCTQENDALAKWCAELEVRKITISKFRFGEGEKFIRSILRDQVSQKRQG